MKEKLIITCEIENIPEDSNILDFQLIIIERGWFSRIFKDWRRISYRKAYITKMDVVK